MSRNAASYMSSDTCSPSFSGILSSRRHQRCLYGQAQELKLWSRVYSSISARSRERSERACGACGPGKRQCCNHRAREMNINASKSSVYFFNSSNVTLQVRQRLQVHIRACQTSILRHAACQLQQNHLVLRQRATCHCTMA